MNLKSSIKKLPEDGLFLVYQDAINRIGSHSLGGCSVPEYIRKQEEIISVVQDELKERKQIK
ncbi:hypothetical protein [Oceanobacillus sp. CF4.6]|uniref:hypothetical protein n=1 Tax=Oceanobacillus sp. CF4.6 TaxID=3373080 RepID=UPI003EE81A83